MKSSLLSNPTVDSVILVIAFCNISISNFPASPFFISLINSENMYLGSIIYPTACINSSFNDSWISGSFHPSI